MRYLCLTLLLALAGCFSGFKTTEQTVDVLGPDGGILAITTGILEGFRLIVPPGALTESLEITVRSGRESDGPNRLSVGPSARIVPLGVALQAAVTVEVPFEAERVPLGVATQDLRVAYRGADDVVRTLVPQVSADEETLIAFLPEFATVWAVSPQGADLGEFLPAFPLQAGNRWEFTGGVTISLSQGTPVNFDEPVWQWVLEDGGGADFGFYLDEVAGAIVDRGRFSLAADLQEVLQFPIPLFPARLSGSRVFTGQSDASVFTPFGNSVNPLPGVRSSLTTVVGESAAFSPVGNFTDAIEIVVEQAWEVAGLEGELQARLWFVRGIGPVQLRLGGGPDQVLIRARVNGSDIGLPSTGVLNASQR